MPGPPYATGGLNHGGNLPWRNRATAWTDIVAARDSGRNVPAALALHAGISIG